MYQRNIRVPRAFPAVILRLCEVSQPTKYVRDLLTALQHYEASEDKSLKGVLPPSTPPLRLPSYTSSLRIDTTAVGEETFRLNFPSTDKELLNFVSQYVLSPEDYLPSDVRYSPSIEALALSSLSEIVTALVYIDICNRCCGDVDGAFERIGDYWAQLVLHPKAKQTRSVGKDLWLKLSRNRNPVSSRAEGYLNGVPNRSAFLKWLIRRDIARAYNKAEPPKPMCEDGKKPEPKDHFEVHLSLRGKHNADILSWIESRDWLKYGSYADRYIKGSIDSMLGVEDAPSYYVASLVCAYEDAETTVPALDFVSVADIA